MSKYVFTRIGYNCFNEQLKRVQEHLARATKEKGEAGAGQDAWHDEGHKISLVEEMMWSQRLGCLQEILSDCKIIDPQEQNETISIGNGVVIEYTDGTIKRFYIEGYVAEPSLNIVSLSSPLGRLLIGARVGDSRTFILGNIRKVFLVKEIILPSEAICLLE